MSTAKPTFGIKDRRELVRRSNKNGIDFIQVETDQRTLLIHFLNEVEITISDLNNVLIVGGESIPSVPVRRVLAPFDKASKTLKLETAVPGDFSRYTLQIKGEASLDPYFSQAKFSFKANCPLDWGIEPSALRARPPERKVPPIDYLAKDFQSFRKALMDFSSARYPDWQERSEADFGVMFMEALAAMADDLSYYQDRVAAEAYLDTATERRSGVRHARLLDYEPRPATVARVLLKFSVGGDVGRIYPGVAAIAQGPEGTPVVFETGMGLFDSSGGYVVRSCWNEIVPYFWDEEERVVPAGATELWVEDPDGRLAGEPSLLGRQVLIEQMDALNPQAPKKQALLRIVSAVAGEDELAGSLKLVRLKWAEEDALSDDFDLVFTRICANLVPATQGRTVVEGFRIEGETATGPAQDTVPLALTRLGPASRLAMDANSGDRYQWGDESLPQYLYPLRQGPLAWLKPPDGERPRPEVWLASTRNGGLHEIWSFRRWLLDAGPDEAAFTVDPVGYRALRHQRPDGRVFADYDGKGDTLRFGDGQFGLIPEPGTVFLIRYRVGGGARGNVAAEAITRFYFPPDAPWLSTMGVTIQSVINPYPAEGGADEESLEEVRRLAPNAFRADQPRAVVPADYETVARRLPWVQRAGTVIRWTGSYPVAFTTVDPRGAQEISPLRFAEMSKELGRARMAGCASYIKQPSFVSLDLWISVSVEEGVIRSDVQTLLLDALCSGMRRDGSLGFFHPDRFSFGQPLEKSALHAAIHGVRGVSGVLAIEYRDRGGGMARRPMPDVVFVEAGQIIRVDNDPNRPERGIIRLEAEGGQ